MPPLQGQPRGDSPLQGQPRGDSPSSVPPGRGLRGHGPRMPRDKRGQWGGWRAGCQGRPPTAASLHGGGGALLIPFKPFLPSHIQYHSCHSLCLRPTLTDTSVGTHGRCPGSARTRTRPLRGRPGRRRPRPCRNTRSHPPSRRRTRRSRRPRSTWPTPPTGERGFRHRGTRHPCGLRGINAAWCRPGPVSPGARCPTRPARRVLMATAGPRGWQRATAPISVPSSPGAWRNTPRTWAWQALKVALLTMLHCFWAQDLRYGLAAQGSLGAWASGQDGENFQLLPNSSASPTTDWLRVVKSLRALSSKFPHRPQTLPCGRTDAEMGTGSGQAQEGPCDLTRSPPPRGPQEEPHWALKSPGGEGTGEAA